MVTGGDDFKRLSGVVILSRLSDSSKEKDNSTVALEVALCDNSEIQNPCDNKQCPRDM